MPKRRPALGEETAVQKVSRGEVCAAISAVKGYDAPPRGTIATYRRMRANPTIALARTVATMPVRTADVSFEANGKAGDEHVEFVKGVMEPMWPRLLKDILFALDYGFAAFEKVWEVRGGKMVYGKVKPLLPENTSILETSEHGIFGGLRQGMIDLPTNKCFIFAYDEEAGSKYGRSRHENIRKVWSEWDQIVEREGQYATKVASIIPRVEYPEGKSEDSTGEEFDNVELAKRVLENLCAGRGVAMPNTLAQYAHDLIRGGVDITKLKAWNIDFLETTGTHAAGLEALLRHKESLMMRGWLAPERSAIEGTHGTLAESEEHGDVGVSIAELLLDEILRSVNDYLINPLLTYNYGPALKDGVYMSTAGLSAEQKLFTRSVVQSVLAQPTNIDLFLRLIDYDALLSQVGLPKAAEVVDVGDWTPPAPQPGFDAQSQVQKQAAAIIKTINGKRKAFDNPNREPGGTSEGGRFAPEGGGGGAAKEVGKEKAKRYKTGQELKADAQADAEKKGEPVPQSNREVAEYVRKHGLEKERPATSGEIKQEAEFKEREEKREADVQKRQKELTPKKRDQLTQDVADAAIERGFDVSVHGSSAAGKSQYVEIRRGKEFIGDVRISDHAQPTGGGFVGESAAGSERHGESAVRIDPYTKATKADAIAFLDEWKEE